MSAREVLESKLSRRHPSDVRKWLDDYENEVLRNAVTEIKAAKEKRDEDFYPYFPESYEAEEQGWESAIAVINPDRP